MKELFEPLLKHLPKYLPGLFRLITGPKTTILLWIDEAKGDLGQPLSFVALSVAFGFLIQLPQIGKDQDFTTLVVGMALFKVLAIILTAVIIHLAFRAVRGRADFIQTFSVYLYIVSPLYIVLVILKIATRGVLTAYKPLVAQAESLDPNYFFNNVVQWQSFVEATPGLAISYVVLTIFEIILLFFWFTACWGAFRRLHTVTFWRSVIAGVASLVVALLLMICLEYVLLGMFGTRVPTLT